MQKEMPSRSDYDAASVVVLSGIESIRRRPAMYVGSLDTEGVHQLISELLENAYDEAVAGHCTQLDVVLHTDGSVSVRDDGRGIPVDTHPSERRPTSEVVLTTLHSGGKFHPGPYRRSGGLHGIGLSCVNALSERLVVDIWRDGTCYRQEFSRGAPLGPLTSMHDTQRRGTRLRFVPDRTIFPATAAFDYTRVSDRLEELVALCGSLRASIVDETTGRTETFAGGAGLAGLVMRRSRDRGPLHDEPLYLHGRLADVTVEAALLWTSAYSEVVTSFANGVRTEQGGVHVEALWRAIWKAMKRCAQECGLLANGDVLTGLDVREGLTGAISVTLPLPEFEGQTKGRLTNHAVGDAVEAIVGEHLFRCLMQSAPVTAAIVGRALEAGRARAAARRASERARYRPIDPDRSRAVYQKQFGIRSANWHESCVWLTDPGLLAAHVRLADVGPRARLLDVCCGSGVVGAAFAGGVAETVGLDITAEMRALARARLDQVREGSVYDIPFSDAAFDVVVTREVLHLLPHVERAVGEIFRVLRPGGQFIVGQTVPYGNVDAPWMFRIFKKKQPLFFNNFLAEDYADLFRSVGFAAVKYEEYFLWESIDVWTNSYETTPLHRHEIRELYYTAPNPVREVHPFEILPGGEIRDRWRWCVYSARRPP